MSISKLYKDNGDVARAVIKGGTGVLATPEFGVSEKRTKRKTDSLLLSAPSDLKT